MKPAIRLFARRVLPDFILRLYRRYFHGRLHRQFALERKLLSKVGREILGGPFRGMRYESGAWGSMLGPKLLGSYELELVPAIEEIMARGYSTIVDVGAAEGYYAVGLARSCHSAKVVAFEACEEGRQLMARIAEMNGVAGQLRILGHCSAHELAAELDGRGDQLLICDIEGGEKSLLDPATIGALTKTDILVEVHDCFDLEISSVLAARFSPTHKVTRIKARKRRLADLPVVPGLKDSELLAVASEQRVWDQEWFWMTAHHNSSVD